MNFGSLFLASSIHVRNIKYEFGILLKQRWKVFCKMLAYRGSKILFPKRSFFLAKYNFLANFLQSIDIHVSRKSVRGVICLTKKALVLNFRKLRSFLKRLFNIFFVTSNLLPIIFLHIPSWIMLTFSWRSQFFFLTEQIHQIYHCH